MRTFPFKLPLLACLLFIANHATSQVVTQYQQVLSIPGKLYGNAISATPSGFFIAGGIDEAPMQYHDGMLASLDLDGNIRWSLIVGTSGHEYFTDVVATADGGLMAIGSTQSGSNGLQDACMVSISDSGAMRWAIHLGTTGNDWGVALDTLPGGDAIALIMSDVSGPHEGDAQILRIDAGTGAVAWSATAGTMHQEWPTDLCISEDKIAVVGFHDLINNDKDKIFFALFDTMGVPQSLRILGAPLAFDYPSRVEPLSVADDSWMIAGYEETVSSEPLLALLDSAGNVTDAFLYQVGWGYLEAIARGGPDSSLFLGIRSSFPMASSDYVLAALDQNYQVKWAKAYGGAGREDLQAMAFNPAYNGMLIVGGQGESNTSSQLLMVQTDAAGNAGQCQTSTVNLTRIQATFSTTNLSIDTSPLQGAGLPWANCLANPVILHDTLLCRLLLGTAPPVHARIAISPQPASSHVLLSWGHRHGGKMRITDATGREILAATVPFGEESRELQVQGWPAGRYHVRLSGPFGFQSSPIIITR